MALAKMTWDELNELVGYEVSEPFDEYFAPMQISEEQKRKRVELAEELDAVFIALLSALGIAVAATIGVPILGFIFGVDLAGHKGELCVVMIGGGALAYATFLNTVITIIREQKKMIAGYIVAAILAFVLSRILVVRYEIMGAAALYAIIMCILALTLFIIMLKKLRDAVKEVR